MTRIESITAAMDMSKDLWIIPLDKITFRILIEELEYRNEREEAIRNAMLQLIPVHGECIALRWNARVAKKAGLHFKRKGYASPWKAGNWIEARKKYDEEVAKEVLGR